MKKFKRNLILPQIEYEIILDKLAINLENTTKANISSTPPNK